MKIRANVPRVIVFFVSVLLTVILFSVLAEAKQTNLSERGELVWFGSDGHDREIFLYSKGTITQITNNDYDDYLWD